MRIRRPPWRALVIALLGLNCRLFSTSTHHSTWQQRFQRIQGHRYTEQVLDLRHGPRDPRRLRLLRELLSPKEVGDLLALALSSDVDSKQEILGNPVKTPCQVLARDGAWTQGPLSDFFRPILEQRLLPYMKLALGCATLAPAQVLVRHYGAGVPRSFPAHSDHLAFGTAVLDLTPVNGSGLWVHTAGLADGRDGPDGAFFVPLRSRDVVVHGWDVVHGIHLKEDHQRIAIIVWTQPKEDLGTGLCSWYLREALQGDDSEAAYHLGIEAWRQQMLGSAKLELLHDTLEVEKLQAPERPERQASVTLLSSLGADAEHWRQRCRDAACGVQELRDEALAMKNGTMMKDLGHQLGAGAQRSGVAANGTRMRDALRKGWEHARSQMQPRSRLEIRSVSLRARSMDMAHAVETLAQAGIVVFDDPADRVEESVLKAWHQEFRAYWDGAVHPELQRRFPAAPKICSFQFQEVCSRSVGRYDVRLEGGRGDDLPWDSFVTAVLGDAKELSRGVLLSRHGSEAQAWHRDTEHLFQMPDLPPHAITIFVPLVEITSSLGGTSFLPGSHRVLLTPHHGDGTDDEEAVTLVPRLGAWLAFDSRVLHRGEANVDLHRRDRPLLYFVYSKPWFQELQNFPREAPSLFESAHGGPELGGFYTL